MKSLAMYLIDALCSGKRNICRIVENPVYYKNRAKFRVQIRWGLRR